MGAAPDEHEIEIRLRIGGEEIRDRCAVPKRPTPVRELLPIFRSLTDAIGEATRRDLAGDLTPVSCETGCAACCRQVVPVGLAEARHLARVVEEMPAEERARIEDRFEEALDKLDEAGLLERVRGYPEIGSPEDRQDLGLEYFREWIDCPFLEEELCAIYEDRPLACREYMVTSDPEHCSDPNPSKVQMVKLPRKLSYLLYRFGDGAGNDDPRWIPLLFALEWAEEHAEDDEPRYPARPLYENLARGLSGGR